MIFKPLEASKFLLLINIYKTCDNKSNALVGHILNKVTLHMVFYFENIRDKKPQTTEIKLC